MSTMSSMLFCVLVFISCETNDENLSQSILGIWFQENVIVEDTTLTYRNEIIFNSDGTYERSLRIIETEDAQNTVGYLSLTTGEYEVTGNRLKRFNIEQYGLDNVNPYLDRENLVFEFSTDKLPEIGLIVNNTKGELTIDYFVNNSCPDFAMCIEYETDQSDRKNLKFYLSLFAHTMKMRDSLRLDQVMKFYHAQQIEKPWDKFHAAFVFHHGRKSQLYEIAAALASEAAAAAHLKDEYLVQWLAKAAYDRWMLSIGKPQKYGTQGRVNIDID